MDEQERLAEANRRKLEEHLERMRRGERPQGDPHRADGQDRPAGATGPEQSPGTHHGPGGEDPLVRGERLGQREEKWEAWKRMHGDRIHEVHGAAPEAPERADYKLLGVPPGASKEEIRRAFYREAKRNHPDRGGDPAKFHALRSAYTRLTKEEP